MILRMNSESDILKALNTFLTDIEGLVPYEKACIYFYDLSAPEIVKDCISGKDSVKRSSSTMSAITVISMMW